MAINTKKLLPPSKTTALAVRTSKINISDIGRGGSLVKRGGEGGVLAKEILRMKVKVIKLQGQFDKNKKLGQKEQDDKRKTKEKEQKEKREKQLEKRGPGLNLPNVISRLPGGSIIDTIKRFLGFTFLGWLIGKYDVLMPQLEKFMSIAKPVFEGLVFTTETILKGVYGFIDVGYKAYDKVSETIKQIGGENAEKTFNEFSGHLNKLLNGTLIAAMLIAGSAPGRKPGTMPGKKPSGVPAGSVKPNQRLQNYLGRNNQTKLIERRYGNDAARMYEARRAQGGSHSRALADVQGRFQPVARPQGSLGGTNQGSRVLGRGLTKAPQRAATKMFGKAAGKTVSKLGGRVPIVGPLIDFGIRTLIYKEPLGKAAAGAVGMGVGQALGGWLGGAIGGIVGSVVPFIGTMLVGAAGATVGSLIGGVIGDMIGAALYDFIAGSNKKGKATGKARGGQISSSSRRPRRRVATQSSIRKKIQPQQTKPGKDIGGRYKIEEFYGKEKIQGSNATKGEKIVKALEKTSKDVKKLPLDWMASIGGAYIDMTMGQKPDRKLASDVGKSFGSFVETVVNNEISLSTGQITKALVGMANGGSIPENSSEKGQVSKKVSKNIEERLQQIFDQSYAIANKNLKRESLMQQVEDLREMQDRSRQRQGGGGGGGRGGATTEEQREAFEKIRKIAEKLGSPNPDVTAAIAMLETGWLANPNSVYFASGKTNPFGQTGTGPRGSVIGKDGQPHAIYNNIEEGIKAHLDLWKDVYKGKTPAEVIESIRQGGGRGMYNTNPSWTSKVLSALQSAKMPVSKVEALSTGFRTGLQTGPEGRIGVGTGYHIDGRFMYNVSLKDKIAMLDSMASAHAQEGYVMEFSGMGVAGMRWNPGMPMREKEKFAKKVLASHHANRHPWQAFDYFIIKKTAKDRFDKSAEGANVMAPIIRDGTYEYQEGGGQGRFLIIRDKNGNEVMRILHGDTGVPKPKQLGKVFKMNELTEAQQQLLSSNLKPAESQLQTQQKTNITQALMERGPIPFTFNGQRFFFRVNPDKSVEAFRTRGPLGFLIQERIDISGNKNKAIRQAINATVQSINRSGTLSANPKTSATPTSAKPNTKPAAKPTNRPSLGPVASGYGGAESVTKPKRDWYDPRGWFGMQGGGSISMSQSASSYSSLNKSGLLKEDTSIGREMVVMYQKEIVMVPQTV